MISDVLLYVLSKIKVMYKVLYTYFKLIFFTRNNEFGFPWSRAELAYISLPFKYEYKTMDVDVDMH